MPDNPSREPARDPQDLERLLVSRQRAGDVAIDRARRNRELLGQARRRDGPAVTTQALHQGEEARGAGHRNRVCASAAKLSSLSVPSDGHQGGASHAR